MHLYSGAAARGNLCIAPALSDWISKELRKEYKNKHDQDAPKLVDAKAVGRFMKDLTALESLMSSPKPPLRLVRGNQVLIVKYGFGDASGSGFGASWEAPGGIGYRFGCIRWNLDRVFYSCFWWYSGR